MRPRILALISSVLLAGAGLLWAQTQAPQPPATGHEGHTMSSSKAEGGSMMDECKAMMAKHQAMMDQMKAQDAKLDSLVQAMNRASGSKKVDATAAVVAELVAERKGMRDSMQAMQPMMMEHMMKHLQAGMMKGAMDCPMMQSQKTEEGHEKHH